MNDGTLWRSTLASTSTLKMLWTSS